MTRKFKLTGFLGSIATLSAILGATAPANAITFSFVAGDNGLSTITRTVDGLTLTVDQPADFDGDSVPFETGTNEGLKLTNNSTGSPLPYQFRLTFSQPVKLVSYEVTNAESDGVGDYFNLTQGGVTSLNNSVSTLGVSSFANTTSVFAANVPILFVSGDIIVGDQDDELSVEPVFADNDEVFYLDDITVNIASAAVPFEFSPTLGLLAVGGIWGVSRLRKRFTANRIMDKLA